MTQPFDPISGIITAVCVLFLSGLFGGLVAGWLGHWWSARQPHAPCTSGAAYDADVRAQEPLSEAWIDDLEREINTR